MELRLARPLQSLAVWIEQLVAESTGKDAQGVLPVYDEPESMRATPDTISPSIGSSIDPVCILGLAASKRRTI